MHPNTHRRWRYARTMDMMMDFEDDKVRDGDWRLVPTAANRMPAAASYLRRPGDSEFRAFKLDVLRTRDGMIAEITTFGVGLFPAFGLPRTLGPDMP